MKYPHNYYPIADFLDETQWKRRLHYLDSSRTPHSIAVYEARISKAKVTQTWQLICSVCGKPVVDTKICNCYTHVPCSSHFAIKDQQELKIILGKCGSELHCRYCCQCQQCAGCHKLYKQQYDIRYKPLHSHLCNSCAKCGACCTCSTCYNCGEKIRVACACKDVSLASHHAACCDTEARIKASPTELIIMKRMPRFHSGSDFQGNRCRRFLSIESEVDHFDKLDNMVAVNTVAKKWGIAVVPEGTCPFGGELCIAPASGNAFIEQIRDVLAAYRAARPAITVRCGMHVHVDASDFVYEDLQSLTALYEQIELALFSMLPPWRRISRFVTPCGDQLESIIRTGAKLTGTARTDRPEMHTISTGIATKMAEKLYGKRSLQEVRKIHKDNNNQHIRYMALNLHSWIYRKTFEFRHWPGTIDEEEMTLWPQIVGTIVEYAKRTPLGDIKQLPRHQIEALMEILAPTTWCSAALRPFAERLIRRWSPDFETVKTLLEESKVKDWCVAVPKATEDSYYGALGLGFDMDTGLFTYLRNSSINWCTQWKRPVESIGRYAGINDVGVLLYAHKVAYVKQSVEYMTLPPTKPKPPAPATFDQYGYQERPI